VSYARFGSAGSDVYVFLSVGSTNLPGGWLECCSCKLQPTQGVSRVNVRPHENGLLELVMDGPSDVVLEVEIRDHFRAYTTEAMLGHLAAHRLAGHHVPDATWEGLLRDAAENDATIRGDVIL
jgi:hypothetical protein